LDAQANRCCGQGSLHSIYLSPNVEQRGQITALHMRKMIIKLQTNGHVWATAVNGAWAVIFKQPAFPAHVKRRGGKQLKPNMYELCRILL
jgi:hypothetical protein